MTQKRNSSLLVLVLLSLTLVMSSTVWAASPNGAQLPLEVPSPETGCVARQRGNSGYIQQQAAFA